MAKQTLSAPKMITWSIAVLLALLGVLAKYTAVIPQLAPHAFTLLLAAFVVLAVANLLRDL